MLRLARRRAARRRARSAAPGVPARRLADRVAELLRDRDPVAVGINHAPLAAFLNALLASGLVPVEFEEPGELDPPLFLAVRASA